MKSHNITDKTGKTMLTTAGLLFVIGLAATMASCGKASEPPVYETTPEREYLGSLYYSISDCASCHGPEWNGEGPDAKRMKSMGMAPTNFTTVMAGKTPRDYFLAITDPVGYFKKNKPKGASDESIASLAGSHQYLTYTDKARWDISNFLYYLPEKGQDAAAVAAMKKDLAGIYKGIRRWEIGFPTLESRDKRPTLDELNKKASYIVNGEEQKMQHSVSEHRKEVAARKSRGGDLYSGNCASCHGQYAEGRKNAKRMGLIGMIPIYNGYPRVPELKRQDAVFVSTIDLHDSGAMNSQDAFINAHKNFTTQAAPEFNSIAPADWTELYAYTRALAGR